MKTDDSLLEQLVDIGEGKPVLTAEAMARYRDEATRSGCDVVDVLVAHRVITSEAVARAKAVHFGAEFVDLRNMEIAPVVISLIPEAVAHRFQVVPLETGDGTIRVAIADPSDLDTIDGLQHVLNAQIEISVASETAIKAALLRYYPPSCDGDIENVS